ncbi:MAG: hypothetical protein P4L45_05280, partial [Ignavibacteriaceae bacterium]|nr:hypothetical protein [Ignavibacteriaceae bacterium]
PGDIFGTQQSGFPELKHINLIEDVDVIMSAKKAAFDMIEKDPHLNESGNRIVRKNITEHYSNSLRYAKIA